MAFTEFACRSGGSNLNAGTRTGNSTVPGVAADLTYASGTWVAATGVFTVASGNPTTDGVAVGDFASVYADGSTVTGFVGRVTARDTTTITVSLTAKSGTAPADGTSNRTLKIGGAWKGPNAAEGFPFNFVENALTNSSGDDPRVNFMNDAVYSITAGLTAGNVGRIVWRGFTTSYGDGGIAIVDGGTAGAGYVLLTVSIGAQVFADLEFRNNGATGSAHGITVSSSQNVFRRVVVHDVRSNAFNISSNRNIFVECEAYLWNQSADGGVGFGTVSAQGSNLLRCIAHDSSNSGAGFHSFSDGFVFYSSCIADTCGIGFNMAADGGKMLVNCEAYNNSSDGISLSASCTVYIENCNLVKNGGYGINGNAAANLQGFIINCGFGAGTQANTSGQTNTLDGIEAIGSVTYANDVTPWVDPANGDFRITLAAAKDAGRGTFTQTAASYSGTIGYPDIGAAEAIQASGGSGNPVGLFGGGVM